MRSGNTRKTRMRGLRRERLAARRLATRKNGSTHKAHKVGHAVDFETAAIVAVT